MAIRFPETDVRATGRGAYGVKGVTLGEADEVVSAEVVATREGEPEPTILTVTANGYGKRTELAEYRQQSRGGKGIITIKTTERNGPVVSAISVHESEQVMLITNKGMLIRMPAKGISVIGRNTQGVRLITVESRDEQVAAVAMVAESTAEAEAMEVAGPAAEGGDGVDALENGEAGDPPAGGSEDGTDGEEGA
jgi:DNA gyrase subunit A